MEDLIAVFDERRIGTSPAIFDKERLDWFNGQYIRRMTPEELTERALPFLLRGLPEDVAARLDRAYAARVIALGQERIKTLADVPALTSYFFVEQPEYDATLLLSKQLDAERAVATLDLLLPVLADVADWTHKTLLTTLDRFVTEHGFIRTKANGGARR